QGLFRGPHGERGTTRSAVVELVLRGQKERRAGADAATVGLFARVLEGSADAERQDRVRVREPEALRSEQRGSAADCEVSTPRRVSERERLRGFSVAADLAA